VTATLTTDATRRTPTMPAMAAAPAEATPPRIAAPVPAGSLPSLGIPTVSAAAEEELDVLDVTRKSGVLQPVEQWRGLRAIDVESTSRCQRNRRHRCQNECSHALLLLAFH
jgi:hypothetical protein